MRIDPVVRCARGMLWLVSLASLAVIDSRAEAAEVARKPNILWIVGENFGLDLGCYGARGVRALRPRHSLLRAASSASRTRAGAVPPACARAAADPSSVSTP